MGPSGLMTPAVWGEEQELFSILQIGTEPLCGGRCQSQQEGTGWSHKPDLWTPVPRPVLLILALPPHPIPWPQVSLSCPFLACPGEDHQEGSLKCVGSDPRLLSAQMSPLKSKIGGLPNTEAIIFSRSQLLIKLPALNGAVIVLQKVGVRIQ